jgi:hypothetical protein
MIPHYDEDSYMRKWYTSSFVVYKQEMMDLLLGEIVPSFYGKTTQPRVTYSAKYAYDNHHVPQISVSINNMPAENVTPTSSVKATSIGGLIYNRAEYVWAPYKNNMVFANLGRVRFLVTALSGQIDISDLLAQYPAVEDSEFILENLNGDQIHLVQDSAHFRDDIIYVGKNGYYYVKWISQAVHDELIAGSNYILINEHPVNVVPFYLKNVWDEYANHRNLVRQFGESNLSLKKKCQQASILRKAEETISIALGRGQLYLWNTTNQLNFSGSGVVSLDVFNTLQTAYIAESDVAKDSDGNYRLLYEPSDYVQLFHNSMPVDPESYTVSGSVIIPGTIRLQYAEPGSIKANYATELYSVTRDSDYVSTLTRSACGMESLIVGFTRDVKITNVTKKIKEWRWNEEKGVLAGLAEFS